jgi:hypothetical protein
MSDSNIKQLVVTGDAADSFLKRSGKKTRKGRRNDSITETRKQEGGSTSADATPSVVTNLVKKSLAAESVPATTAPVVEAAKGGAVKVILAAGKGTKKVVLGPAKIKKITPPTAPVIAAPTQKTRKIAKRIRMSIGGLSKRVTRANHIRGEAKKQNIEAVKKTLVEAKLIKADSKAPESILRSMFADYMMLKNKAL